MPAAHPLHDARAALTVPHIAPIMGDLLRCSDTESALCLIHQNFRRTDPSPGPHPELGADGTFAWTVFFQTEGSEGDVQALHAAGLRANQPHRLVADEGEEQADRVAAAAD